MESARSQYHKELTVRHPRIIIASISLAAAAAIGGGITAAEATTRINEVFTGISEEMSDVGLAIQRAEDKTAQMQARAGAIDELMASGALSDALGGTPTDDIQAELDRMGASNSVDNELARMKAELSGGSTPKQIEGGGQVSDAVPGGTTSLPADQQASGEGQ